MKMNFLKWDVSEKQQEGTTPKSSSLFCLSSAPPGLHATCELMVLRLSRSFEEGRME